MAFKVRKDEVRGTKSRTLRSLDQLDIALIGGASTTFAASLQHQVPGSVITNTGTPNSFAASTKGYAPLIAASTTVFDPSSAHQMSPTLIGPGTSAFEANLALALKPDLIDQTGTTNAPDVTVDANTPYPIITNTPSVFAPLAHMSFGWELIPGVTSVLAPTLNTQAGPGLIDQQGSTYNPVFNRAYLAPLIDSSGITFGPSVSQSILVQLIQQAGVAFAPSAASGLSPARIDTSATLYQPGAFPLLSAPAIGSGASLYGPSLNQRVAIPAIASGTALFEPRPSASVVAGLISSLGTTSAFSIKLGVAPELISHAVLYEPAKINNTYLVPLIASLASILSPSVYRIFSGKVTATVEADLSTVSHVRWFRATSSARFIGPEQE